jgi:hypothetical protein
LDNAGDVRADSDVFRASLDKPDARNPIGE